MMIHELTIYKNIFNVIFEYLDFATIRLLSTINKFLYNMVKYEYTEIYNDKMENLILKSDNIFLYIKYNLISHINSIVSNGSLLILNHVLQKGFKLDEETCPIACAKGKLECLKLLLKYGGELNSKTCMYSASGGSLECLKYSHDNGCGCIFGVNICLYAIVGGHLECLEYIHKNGCEFSKMETREAHENGKFEILKYLHKNKCP